MKATALIYVATAALYAVGSIPVTAHILRQRTLPVMFGIPFYQGSFTARQGFNGAIASSFAFILVGVANVVTGYLLWNSFRSGAILAIATFPLIMAISIGGGAPVPLLLEPVKLLLAALSWFSIH